MGPAGVRTVHAGGERGRERCPPDRPGRWWEFLLLSRIRRSSRSCGRCGQGLFSLISRRVGSGGTCGDGGESRGWLCRGAGEAVIRPQECGGCPQWVIERTRGQDRVIHTLCRGWGQKYRTFRCIYVPYYPQIGDTVGIGVAGEVRDQRERCWDLIRLVRSVT